MYDEVPNQGGYDLVFEFIIRNSVFDIRYSCFLYCFSFAVSSRTGGLTPIAQEINIRHAKVFPQAA